MKDHQRLFSDFSSTTKAEWLAKVEKDLKGKPLQDLNWQLGDGLVISPFHHREDLRGQQPRPLEADRLQNEWEIGAYVRVADPKEGNAQALEALQGGVEALGFEIMQELDTPQLAQLLTGIDVSIVSLNFGEMYAEKHPLKFLLRLIDLAKKQGWDRNAMRGSIDFDPILDWADPPLGALAESLRLAQKELPAFKMLQINGAYYHAGVEESVNELGFILAKASEYLAQLQARKIDPAQAVGQMQISVAISTSYFVEMAKLRALRILLANLLKGYGLEQPEMPELVVHFARESQDENANTNLIRATTQAMSAVIGGADRLYVLPANMGKKEEATEFTRRMARNLQHLLKMEAYLNRVIDPAAGSYYIEHLTAVLAGKAWERFRELEAERAFN